MDPVTQTLAQQTSGSAGGQGFGQFFVAGQQDARQRQQLNLARRQEDRLAERQRALLPYEQAIMGMQVIAAGQTAHFNRMKLENMITANQALPEIMALENYFMSSDQGYKDEVGIQAYQKLYGKYPQAFAEGAPGYSMRLQIKAPIMFDAEMQRLRQANAQLSKEDRDRGLYVQRFNEQGGPVLGELSQAASSTDIRNQQYADQLRTAIETLPNGSPERQQLETKLAEFQSRSLPSGTSQKVYDPQGNMIFESTTGRPPTATSGLAPQVVAKAQSSMQEARKAIVALDDMEVRMRDVGIWGVLGELADDFGPQFGLSNADLQRMDTRTKIKSFVESAKRTVTDDDRFTEGDRAAVKDIVISEGIRENEQSAKQTKATLKQLFGVRSLIEAQTLKVPAPLWAMHALTQKRLLEAIEDGLLTDHDIMNAFDAGLINENQAVAAREKRIKRPKQ